MAKDPAFLFYSSDFLSGIQDLSMEERGQYITLLCLQHQKGHLSEKLIRLCLGNAAADVMAKFRQDPAGLWYNERLDLEIEKRRAHGKKQSERATAGWQKRQKQKDAQSHGIESGNAAALPLEDENVNEDENELKNKKERFEKFEPLPDRDYTQPDVRGDTIVFPFDTGPFRQLWAAWKKARADNHGQVYGMQGEQAELRKLNGKTYQQAEQAILDAIAGKWKNLYPKNGNGFKKPGITAQGTADRLNSYTD